MDDVLAMTLKQNLQMSTTKAEKENAMTMAMIAMVDCQKKTADRVKTLVNNQQATKNKQEGAKWAAKIIYTILTLLGASAGVIACKLFGAF